MTENEKQFARCLIDRWLEKGLGENDTFHAFGISFGLEEFIDKHFGLEERCWFLGELETSIEMFHLFVGFIFGETFLSVSQNGHLLGGQLIGNGISGLAKQKNMLLNIFQIKTTHLNAFEVRFKNVINIQQKRYFIYISTMFLSTYLSDILCVCGFVIYLLKLRTI